MTSTTHQQLSAAASSCLVRAARACQATHDGDACLFDHGAETSAHAELMRFGLITKMLGTEKGFAWTLSERGLARVRSIVLGA